MLLLGGVQMSVCVQGKERTVHARAAGAGPWVRRAAVPGRPGKGWAAGGTARLCLLIWALRNRFVLTDTHPHGSGNAVCRHPARVRVSERWRRAGGSPRRCGHASGGAKRRLGVGGRGVCAWR